MDTSNDFGIWSDIGGSLALVGREGNSAPSTSTTFSLLSGPALNNAGQMAFWGQLNSEENNNRRDSGIWLGESGSLAVLAASVGSTAPGTDAKFVSFRSPALNNLGQMAFAGKFQGLGVDRQIKRGIWSDGSGSLTLIAREGSEAPGTNADFSSLGMGNSFMLTLNDSGQTAFLGWLTGEEVDDSNRTGIWSEGKGELNLVVRTGDEAPGTNSQFSYLGMPVINEAGQTLFMGSVTGDRVFRRELAGIWSEGHGPLALVARLGGDAPGTESQFASFNTKLGMPVLNDAGQAAFMALLAGTGVNKTNSRVFGQKILPGC